MEESSAVKAEARFEPGETPQEAISPVKADVEFNQPAHDLGEAAASGEAMAVDQSEPASKGAEEGPNTQARLPEGQGSPETPAVPKASVEPSKPELKTESCKEEVEGEETAGPPRAKDTLSKARDRDPETRLVSGKSVQPSEPELKTEHCEEETDDGETAGPSQARDIPASTRDRPLVPKTGVKLGSGKLRLLQEVARADEANWKNLQEALTKAEEDGSIKQELVDDLSRLTEQRKAAAEGIQQSLETEIQRIKDAEEEDEGYLSALDAQGRYMRELEKKNLVRPSKSVKILKSARLDLEIEAGVGVWVARRREKGRLRAQAHRERTRGGARGCAEPLTSPEEAEEVRKEAARKEIRDFKASLLQADGQPKRFRRAPDSQKRKEVIKEAEASDSPERRRQQGHQSCHRTCLPVWWGNGCAADHSVACCAKLWVRPAP